MNQAGQPFGLRAFRRLTCGSASLTFAVGLAVLVCGCESASKAPSASERTPQASTSAAALDSSAQPGHSTHPSASSAALAALPNGIKQPDATTSPSIALENFSAQVEQLERLVKAEPDKLMFLTSAVSAYLDKVTYFGQMSALERAIELAEQATKLNPKDAKAFLLRSSVRGAIHDFKGALADLDTAAKFGAEDFDVAPKRAVVAMALGRYDDAEPVFAAEVKRFPNLSTLALHAVCLGHMGKTAASEADFLAAEATYRDVSPFAISWLYFNRAEMWDRAGDPDRARALYGIAVERLPIFARATIHLSELLPPARGKPLVEKVLPTSDDPEVSSALFLINDALAPGSGSEHLARASKGYDELMAKYPLAFSDHAAEFHLHATKDPKKATEAAKINIDNRKTAESYELYLEALVASGDAKGACKLADDAGTFPYATTALRVQRIAAYRACGKPELAAKIATGLPEPKP